MQHFLINHGDIPTCCCSARTPQLQSLYVLGHQIRDEAALQLTQLHIPFEEQGCVHGVAYPGFLLFLIVENFVKKFLYRRSQKFKLRYQFS